LLAASSAVAAAAAEENHLLAMQLAAKIAALGDGKPATSKPELLAAYEKTYGSIATVPVHWPALVRRALVCRETGDRICTQSSIAAIEKMGGANALPLDHLLEVSHFKMPVATMRALLRDSSQAAGKDLALKHGTAANAAVGSDKNAAAAATQAATAIPANTHGDEASPTIRSGAKSAAPKAAIKPLAARSLVERAGARLQKLGAGSQSGLFLNALFVAVAVSLSLAYFLYASIRSRKAVERRLLEAEQGRGEVESGDALDAHKARSEHVLSLARQETKREAEEALQAEKLRAAALLDEERARNAAVIEAANARADQAIDAYTRMSSEELEVARRQIEELRQALHVQQQRAETHSQEQELKTRRALLEAETFKEMEARLQDATSITSSELAKALERIDALQLALDSERQRSAMLEARAKQAQRAIEMFDAAEASLRDAHPARQSAELPEMRKLTEKLKSAQRAVIALHASLIATREMNTELQKQVTEAKQAADSRVLESRRSPAMRPAQESGSAAGPERGAAVVSTASNDA
jgi:hypothetical protein